MASESLGFADSNRYLLSRIFNAILPVKLSAHVNATFLMCWYVATNLMLKLCSTFLLQIIILEKTLKEHLFIMFYSSHF